MTDEDQGGETIGGFGSADTDIANRLKDAYARIRRELSKTIVGQDEVLEQLFVAMFADGHCILEGVPGLAKTMMISSIAQCVDLSFNRIQFTPDLMPSDITGTEVIQEDRSTGSREFRFLAGPIFANVLLADEINRTPPKTQAALLEAMQERHVTVGGNQHDLPLPFFVLATQNPIEQEGTYPLPEAQQDRFMFKVLIQYPSYEDEYAVAEQTTAPSRSKLETVLPAADVHEYQQLVRRVPAAPDVIRYALNLVRSTRSEDPLSPDFVKNMLSWGAGPRAVQALLLGGKSRALLHGRHHVSVSDIKALSHPVLRHRIVTNFSAEAEGYSSERVIDELLATVDPNATHLDDDDQIAQVLSA